MSLPNGTIKVILHRNGEITSAYQFLSRAGRLSLSTTSLLLDVDPLRIKFWKEGDDDRYIYPEIPDALEFAPVKIVDETHRSNPGKKQALKLKKIFGEDALIQFAKPVESPSSDLDQAPNDTALLDGSEEDLHQTAEVLEEFVNATELHANNLEDMSIYDVDLTEVWTTQSFSDSVTELHITGPYALSRMKSSSRVRLRCFFCNESIAFKPSYTSTPSSKRPTIHLCESCYVGLYPNLTSDESPIPSPSHILNFNTIKSIDGREFVLTSHPYFNRSHLNTIHPNQVMMNCFHMYKHLPFLGIIKSINNSIYSDAATRRGGDEPSDMEYEWLTYGEVEKYILKLASSMSAFDSLETDSQQPKCFLHQSRIGIAAPNSVEWILMFLAGMRQGLTTVPLHVSLTVDQIFHIASLCQLTTILVHPSVIESVMEGVDRVESVRIILTVNMTEAETLEWQNRFPSKKYLTHYHFLTSRIMCFAQFVSLGSDKTIPPPVRLEEYDLVSISFTSGSTGMPKGSPDSASGIRTYFNYSVVDVDISLSVWIEYLPYAHGLGRDNFFYSMISAGRIALFQRDLKFLFEDIPKIRPNDFYGVPAIWNQFYSNYLAAVKEAQNHIKTLCDADANLNRFNMNLEASARVKQKFRESLGDRIASLSTGTAKIDRRVLETLRLIFSPIPVHEYYGITEVGGIAANDKIHSDVEWKLDDVPELGYYATDTPHPRGELLVKTRLMIDSYHCDSASTQSSFTADGYFRTGDIVELYKQDPPHIRIIDRRKFMLKLTNGEFVAPSELETLFVQSPLIDQIYVHGNLDKDFLVAVVVPNFGAIKAIFPDVSEDSLYESESYSNYVHDIIKVMAKNARLSHYQVPAAVTLVNQAFTAKRNLEAFFKGAIDSMYTKVSESYNELESALDAQLSEFSPVEGGSFESAGLSSVARVKIQISIENITGKKISADAIANSHSIKEIISHVDMSSKQASLSGDDPDTASKQYEDTMIMAVADSRWDPTISAALQTPHSSPSGTSDTVTSSFSSSSPSKILLTGASGFVGCAVLLELLLTSTAKIVCVMRGGSEAEGKLRLMTLLNSLNKNLTQREFERLSVYLCDLRSLVYDKIESPDTETTPEEELRFEPLRKLRQFVIDEGISHIVHSAAEVNWVKGYSSLRNVNCVATKCLLSVAVENERLIPFIFVSSISASPFVDETIHDIQKVRLGSNCNIILEVILAHSQMNLEGYGLSKAVGERLCLAAIEKHAPVMVVRPSYITPSPDYPLFNKDDFLNRYIMGVLQLKCFPALVERHQGLSVSTVDFVSSAICSLLTQNDAYGRLVTIPSTTLLFSTLNNALRLKSTAKSTPSDSHGDPLVELPHKEFVKRLAQSTSLENPLLPILPLLDDIRFFNLDDRPAVANFYSLLQNGPTPRKLAEEDLLKIIEYVITNSE